MSFTRSPNWRIMLSTYAADERSRHSIARHSCHLNARVRTDCIARLTASQQHARLSSTTSPTDSDVPTAR